VFNNAVVAVSLFSTQGLLVLDVDAKGSLIQYPDGGVRKSGSFKR